MVILGTLIFYNGFISRNVCSKVKGVYVRTHCLHCPLLKRFYIFWLYFFRHFKSLSSQQRIATVLFLLTLCDLLLSTTACERFAVDISLTDLIHGPLGC